MEKKDKITIWHLPIIHSDLNPRDIHLPDKNFNPDKEYKMKRWLELR